MGPLRRLAARLRSGCPTPLTPLYLQAGFGLGFEQPPAAGGDSYVSDPAKPVPYLPRPVQLRRRRRAGAAGWCSDQRPVAGRHRRADLRDRAVLTSAAAHRRRADRRPLRRHHRHRRRLGGQADRRLSRRGAVAARDGRLSAGDRARHLPRPLSRQLRAARRAIPAGQPQPIASRCRRRTTSSCPATGSWCRSSRACSRSTTATRRPSSRTSSSRSRSDYRPATHERAARRRAGERDPAAGGALKVSSKSSPAFTGAPGGIAPGNPRSCRGTIDPALGTAEGWWRGVSEASVLWTERHRRFAPPLHQPDGWSPLPSNSRGGSEKLPLPQRRAPA